MVAMTTTTTRPPTETDDQTRSEPADRSGDEPMITGQPAVATASAGLPGQPGGVRSWPLLLLAAPAFVAIWSGWVGLGELTGFGQIHPLPGTPVAGWTLNTAITLPVGVETYAAYALRVWLTRAGTVQAIRFARLSAIGSLMLGAAGQVAYHLMAAAHVTRAPWQIVTVVACLPVAVLGMGAALAHLVHNGQLPTTGRSVDGDSAARLADVSPAVESHGTLDMLADRTPDTTTRRTVTPPRMAARTPGRTATRTVGRTRTADAVARLVGRYPDMTTDEIARRIGVTDRTVRRHLAGRRTTPPAAEHVTAEAAAEHDRGAREAMA
jgi:hypothetical protein